MPKSAKDKNPSLEAPNYEAVKSIDEVEKKIEETKNTIVRKFRLQEQVKSDKKRISQSYADQLKHLKEELEHELGVLGGWEDRIKVLAAGGDAALTEGTVAQAVAKTSKNLKKELEKVVGEGNVEVSVSPAIVPLPPPLPPPAANVPMPSPAAFAPPPPPPAAQPAPKTGSIVPFPKPSAA